MNKNCAKYQGRSFNTTFKKGLALKFRDIEALKVFAL